ncbi:GOLPH3/VPS74 family protein [Luteococcus peritonei]|uniref:GPP34 family phosphoprotein n=1 Tax=Luteococcus peritonei TaxID=88874 RepID=A0ABW4RY94_9ACTN
MEMPTAAHELELLALDPESGARRRAQAMSYAIPSLLLAELALRGRLEIRDGLVTVVDPTPTGIALLDRQLDAVQQDKPRKPQALVRRLRRGADTSVLEELTALGAVRPQQAKALGLFPVDHHLPSREATRQVSTTTLAEASGSQPSARALLLAWGLRIGRLEKQLLGPEYREQRSRVEERSARELPAAALALLKGGEKARVASESAAAAG